MENKWWEKATIYQIYPKSFQDSNDDGIGDIPGIIERLDYLAYLGIDAIWISPVYQSPQADNGYDISNYQEIDSMFGTMNDMEKLISKAKKYNIKIIMDLVLNHTSDEHPWFIEAKKGKKNRYHDFYVWRDGKKENPPNNMTATFGGSAWEWVEEVEQFYFHQFTVKQPDLNWENKEVRESLYHMMQWWLDKGIGGFRLDVIDQIAKEPNRFITCNGPRLHEFIKEMSASVFQNKNIVTVGEAWGANIERATQYSNPDASEFSMVFQFEHIGLDQLPGKSKWDLSQLSLLKLKEVMTAWQTGLYQVGWNSLFWNSHDLPRIVSRWGNDKEYRVESAKMLATLLHGMQGTPYIYQGEELGMTNVKFPINEYRDIEIINMYQERKAEGYAENEIMKSIYAKGRDNARTPMQWDDTNQAGFTKGIPWIKINPNYININAKKEIADSNSVFHYYKKLIGFRKKIDVFTTGDFQLLLKENKHIFAYKRNSMKESLYVICNFYKEVVTFDLEISKKEDKKILISNYEEIINENILRPYEARIYFVS